MNKWCNNPEVPSLFSSNIEINIDSATTPLNIIAERQRKRYFNHYSAAGSEEAQANRKTKEDPPQPRYFSVTNQLFRKNKGGKWWDKMMYIYFADVTQEDIISCT
jgi:hypothetical protein